MISVVSPVVAQAVVQAPSANAVWRILQFAALLLELGGAILIAALFAAARRSSIRRAYFDTWTLSWLAMAVGIGALAARYFLIGTDRGLLPGGPAGAPGDSDPTVRALYWVYQCGKIAYWVLIWRGVVEFAAAPGGARSRWPWLAAAVAMGTLALAVSRDLNDLLVLQALVAVAACARAATLLMAMPPSRRSVGVTTTAVVLTATAVIWALYFLAFGSAVNVVPAVLGPVAPVLLDYNSYVDMLLLVMLGYAMLMVFMEDARKRVSDAETRLAQLVTSSPLPIVTLDESLRVLDANAAADRMFGGAMPLPRGAAVDVIVSPSDRPRLQSALAALRASDEPGCTVGHDEPIHARRADGSTFSSELVVSRLRGAADATLSVMVRDVTERSAHEQRRQHVSTMEAVRQLAGGLAHDFNNLLTTIVGRSQIVARTLPPTAPAREDVQQIQEAASAAARLAQNLLALSRREPLNPVRLDVDAAARACEPAVREVAGEDVRIEWRLGAAGAEAHVDRDRLRTTIAALAANAAEAMEHRGVVTIETSRAHLPQPGGGTSDAVSVCVRDTGPGLHPHARAHLFEPFFSTKADGRGLGLATTWAFVQQSGGTVNVESGPQGTTVRLLFPMAAVGAPPAAPVAPAVPPAPPALSIVPGPRRAGGRVLLVDDEALVRRSVRIFLERAGLTVTEAVDGVEAAAEFARAPTGFDVVLTDVVMPRMNGRELVRRIREIRHDVPVVVMSGMLSDQEVLGMVNRREVRFVAKPFDVDTLVDAVRDALDTDASHVA